MHYFITGCAGFIGSNLVDRLLQDNHVITGYDNFSTGFEEFLKTAQQSKNFKLVKGDVLDTECLRQAMQGADMVFHFAANADVRFGVEHPSKDLQQNTIATFNVLEAMRTNQVKRIVFSSTGSIYGEAKVIPTPEDAPLPVQTSLYGASKLAGEGLIEAYCEGFDFQGYILSLTSYDPSPEYRTYISLSTLFVIFVFLGCYNLVCTITSREKARTYFIMVCAFITIFGVFVANYNVTNYFVIPDSLEFRYIKNEALHYQKSTGHNLSSINIVRLAQSLAPTGKRNEIGEQSAYHGPNIRPMVMTALSELGVSNDLRVTFSDSINAPVWTEHGRVLVNIFDLPKKTIPADKNTAIIDMSRLNTQIK